MNARRGVAVAVAVVVLAAGCSDGPDYDASSLEEAVAARLDGAWGDLAVGDVSCPEDEEIADTMSVECTVEVAGAEVPVTVELTGAESDAMSMTVTPAGVVSLTEWADAVNAGLDGEGLSLACADPDAVPAVAGTAFTCVLTSGSEQIDLDFEVADETGRIGLPGSAATGGGGGGGAGGGGVETAQYVAVFAEVYLALTTGDIDGAKAEELFAKLSAANPPEQFALVHDQLVVILEQMVGAGPDEIEVLTEEALLVINDSLCEIDPEKAAEQGIEC